MPTTNYYPFTGVCRCYYLKRQHTSVWGQTWAALAGGAGTNATTDVRGSVFTISAPSGNGGYLWYILSRLYLPINTQGLPAGAAISAANFKAYLYSKQDLPGRDPTLRLYGHNGASDPNACIASDFNYTNIGWVALSDYAPALSALTASSTITFPLNAAGLAFIKKAGITQLVFCWEYDGSNWETEIPPTGSLYQATEAMFNTVSNSTPILEVTYTIPKGGGGQADKLIRPTLI